jgi:hypothetical protein
MPNHGTGPAMQVAHRFRTSSAFEAAEIASVRVVLAEERHSRDAYLGSELERRPSSAGDTRSVGLGGLTPGGGIGWLVRGRGLTIDSLRAAAGGR